MSDSDLQSYGFYDVVIPEYNSNIQTLGDIEFDSNNNVYTYPVVDLTWSETLAELKEAKIASLKQTYRDKLVETDWYIIRAQEGVAAPQEILDARATLRTECDTHEAAVNALTTKANVQSYEF